ncbi:helix-turn-helix transcriptional regulator [Paenibacillus qinlingensis]|uniref:helix-turn-helix transcriptional regulator n=1 Tax=Paenibacillus qinlingensis TaxID=1837343 RepID=UPI00156793A4|nr:AraC family transcriptional regulator [Paenibacillus qinlingensis]NQX63662.1 helix-turn-helix transcriptional regulator [Paenibacillus qinlingensis]
MSELPTYHSLRNVLTNIQVDVIIANLQTVGPDWQRRNFVHSFNRLYYIRSGEGRIEVDGAVYHPKPGQLVLMPCHTIQSYSTVNDNTFNKYWCHFTARVGNRDLFEMYRFPVCIDVPSSSEVEVWFERIVSGISSSGLGTILDIKASLLHLLGIVVDQHFEETASPSASTQKMGRVLQYIEEHLQDRITVEQLADLVHYHPNYFIRSFHSVLGCSPIQYINRLRMEKARTMLASDQSIGSIAQAVGIEQHNFSTMFKNATGFSPREFRRMLVHDHTMN